MQPEVIERGDIYFVYRPGVREEGESDRVEGLDDVQQFWMILHPHDSGHYRLILIGPKKLLESDSRDKRFWGHVNRTADTADELVQFLQPEHWPTEKHENHFRPGARPAGEGVYALMRHSDHTHLVYVLELPHDLGPVQADFNIQPEGDHIVLVRNPGRPTKPDEGQGQPGKPALPDELLQLFRDHQEVPADPPALMDYAGIELLFLNHSKEIPEHFETELNPEEEVEATADLFEDLRLDRSQHPVAPLLTGEWA